MEYEVTFSKMSKLNFKVFRFDRLSFGDFQLLDSLPCSENLRIFSNPRWAVHDAADRTQIDIAHLLNRVEKHLYMAAFDDKN